MKTKASPQQSPLKTVDRALEVLLSFNERRTDWGVMELAHAFNIDKSSAQRILASLAARQFLRADPITRRYSLGPAMWRMAALWERTGGLASLARHVLEPLAADTDRTALFAIPDGLYVRCIAAVDGASPMRSHPLVGELYPANAGATSRGYFAFLPPAERRALTGGLIFPRFSELTAPDAPALEVLFDQTIRNGYAFSDGEYDFSTRAIALPVYMRTRPIGSLSLGETKFPERDDVLQDFVPRLQQAAAELSSLLDRQSQRMNHKRRQRTQLELSRSRIDDGHRSENSITQPSHRG